MRYLVSFLVLAVYLAQPVSGWAACTFTWNEPTTKEDGTPLDNLAGYYLYLVGTTDSLVADVPAPSTSFDLATCQPGDFYYITAYNMLGIESVPSNSVEVVDRRPPSPPSGLSVMVVP